MTKKQEMQVERVKRRFTQDQWRQALREKSERIMEEAKRRAPVFLRRHGRSRLSDGLTNTLMENDDG